MTEVSLGEAGTAARTLLVLWDVDHTLIENNGVNKETYAYAFELLTGRPAEYPARTDGRTEPEIMRDMLTRHGIEPTADHFARMPEALEAATSSKAPSFILSCRHSACMSILTLRWAVTGPMMRCALISSGLPVSERQPNTT